MATYASLPYGLTDLIIEPLDDTFTPLVGQGVKLLNGQTMDVTINEDQTDEEGYGVVVGTVYSAVSADVTLHAAGTDLDALAKVTGGTVVSSGSSPNVVQTLDLGVVGQARPYCRVTGKALGNNGGDAWKRINAVRFGLPGGGFDHKAFNETDISGRAIAPTAGPASGKLMTNLHHQTATALTPA
jgi:hypothetical protein